MSKKVKKSISGSLAAPAGRNAQQKGRQKMFVVMEEKVVLAIRKLLIISM